MEFFKKITNSISRVLLSEALARSYGEFVNQPDEFNAKIIDCYDAGYAVSIVNELLKEGIEITNQKDNGVCQSIAFLFEDWNYALHIFRHYAKVATVVTSVITDVTDEQVLSIFCNKINRIDKLHQVGYVKNPDGTLEIVVKRQFMLTPSVGSVDTLKEGLRDLREYSFRLSELDEAAVIDEWKKYAQKDNASIHTPVHSAEEEWFPEDKNKIIRTFTKNVKLIQEDDSVRIHEMIQLAANGFRIRLGNNEYLAGQFGKLLNMTIITYKDYPLLLTMQGVRFPLLHYGKVSKESAVKLCDEWNRSLHFSLSRITYQENSNGGIELTLTMSGLFGEDLNTETFEDFLGTMHKTVALLMKTK